MSSKNKPGDYEVGYGRPPKKHQFPKGQSGNPKGRPKGRKNTRNLIDEVANERVEITIAGKKHRVSVKEAIIRGAFYRAIQGDRAALKEVMPWLRQTDPEVSKRYVIEAPAPMSLEEWEARNSPKSDHEPPENPIFEDETPSE